MFLHQASKLLLFLLLARDISLSAATTSVTWAILLTVVLVQATCLHQKSSINLEEHNILRMHEQQIIHGVLKPMQQPNDIWKLKMYEKIWDLIFSFTQRILSVDSHLLHSTFNYFKRGGVQSRFWFLLQQTWGQVKVDNVAGLINLALNISFLNLTKCMAHQRHSYG